MLFNMLFWLVIAGVFIMMLIAIYLDPKRMGYEGSHAVRNAAFKLTTTIYDNQVREIREDTLRDAAYQKGWNDCVERLLPGLRPRP